MNSTAPPPPSPGWFRVSNHTAELAHEVGTTAWGTYVAMARHADEGGCCYPSFQRLADMTGVHKNTVRRAVLRLEEAGWIDVDRANGSRNVYRLLAISGSHPGGPSSPEPTPLAVSVSEQRPTPPVVPTDTAGGTPPTPLVERTDTASGTQRRPKKKTQEEDLKRRPKKKASVAASAELPKELDTEAFRQKWGEWIKYRTAARKTLTTQTAAKQLKELAGWGEATAEEAIEISIKRGWTGLFEPKGKHDDGRTQDTRRAFRQPDDPARVR